jgi:putative ABC transport system substrate-binding protein
LCRDEAHAGGAEGQINKTDRKNARGIAQMMRVGLFASEARPGGNVTGIEPYVAGLPAKQMEFVREIAPGATRIGLLTNLPDPKAPPQRQKPVLAAKALELTIAEADINSPDDVESAMEALAKSRVDVVIVLQTALLLSVGQQIAEFAMAKRLPSVYGYRKHVLDGGLISYGVDLRWCFRRGAYFRGQDSAQHATCRWNSRSR